MKPIADFFDREIRLIGSESFERLSAARVMLCGLGGVGGGALEALVRGGIGHLVLIDMDRVDITNLTRQLVATAANVGIDKTEAAARRVLEIRPDADVAVDNVFITPENTRGLLEKHRPDYVIDAIDNVSAKISLAVHCAELGIPLISSMGTGNKLDPTRFRVTDISKTSVCPLARVMRYELRKRGIAKLKVLWSDEVPIKPQDGEKTPASISFVPPVGGMIIAGEVIKDIMKTK